MRTRITVRSKRARPRNVRQPNSPGFKHKYTVRFTKQTNFQTIIYVIDTIGEQTFQQCSVFRYLTDSHGYILENVIYTRNHRKSSVFSRLTLICSKHNIRSLVPSHLVLPMLSPPPQSEPELLQTTGTARENAERF